MHYKLLNIQYLYKDQYGKHIFLVPKSALMIGLLKQKIDKYETINPVYQKTVESDFTIKFNNTAHNFKSRVFYDLIYFIHKNQNPKTKKYYINLHISDVKQCNKKAITKIAFESL